MKHVPVLFLFLLLLAGLLAPAGFASGATTSYYGLSFDGSSSYVEAPNTFDLEDFTIIVIGNIHWTGEWQSFVNKGVHGVWFGVAGEVTPNLYLLIGNGTVWEQSHKYYTSSVFDRVTMVGARWNGVTSSIIVNGKVVSNKTYTGASFSVGDNNVVRIGNQYYSNAYPTNGTIYEVLIYNRALSDSEIQQIYQDPLHPPTSGLVLFYAPDSVDTASNVWHDKSGNGNDGSIVGATPERVSIPKASYYDASNSSPISPLDVSVAMTYNNTTISLIPSFLTLPYNETVALNVSATGYEPSSTELLTTVNNLAIYLQPVPTNTTPLGNTTIPTHTVPQELANYSQELNLRFSDIIGNYFSTTLGVVTALILAIGLASMSLVYHHNTFTTLAVFGVTVSYLASYANAPWGLAWTPLVMWVGYGLWKMVGKGAM